MSNMAIGTASYKKGSGKPDVENLYPGKPIAEMLTTGFLTVNREWTVKYWNKAAEKILGVPAKDIVGRNLWEKFAEVIPLDFYTVYHKAFRKDRPFHFEEYWGEMNAWFDVIAYPGENSLSLSFKSSRYPINFDLAMPASCSPQQAHPEQTQSALCIAPVRNMEFPPEYPGQSLKVMNTLYRFVTEVIDNCLWEWDLQTKALFWIDGGHKRILGYDIENALVPQSFWENCLHPDDKSRVVTKLNKMIAKATCTQWQDEYRFKRADGTYVHVQDRGHIIRDADKRASRMIGATQDITEKVLLENKLAEERQARQKEITEAVLIAQEKERSDIGQELHDNLNQILGATKLYIEIARTDEENREIYLEKSSGYIVQVIEEIRKISKVLTMPVLKVMGLFESINILLDDLVAVYPIKIEFYVNDVPEKVLNEKLQLTIFRIVQEQLNNIIKHAKASRATLSLARQVNDIVLVISDNGEGCDLSAEKQGVGLINMRSRAELCHGSLSILSKPGDGFTLKVLFILMSLSELEETGRKYT